MAYNTFCGSIKTFKATKVLKTIKAILNQSKLGGRDVIVMGIESPKLAENNFYVTLEKELPYIKSFSRGHYHAIYQQARKGFIFFITQLTS